MTNIERRMKRLAELVAEPEEPDNSFLDALRAEAAELWKDYGTENDDI